MTDDQATDDGDDANVAEEMVREVIWHPGGTRERYEGLLGILFDGE